ncbi:MAG: serine/threonine-protein phosphatase [Chloroflexia bacterium]|nr:serine/threonine-protein phosphatase [Chloroflexia bacterium]
MLEFQVGVAKTHKYASRASGDTIELVERPHGGLSIFLVDAQGSGLAAKTISNLVISRGAVMIKEGARDGAVARALNDYLLTLRHGRVSATLNILSLDLESRTLVLSRNDECPAFFFGPSQVDIHDEAVHPIGIYRRHKPVIVERALEAYLGAMVVSDGVTRAGQRSLCSFDAAAFLREQLARGWPRAQELADALMTRVLELEQGRPRDDVSVAVVTLTPLAGETTPVRRLSAYFPIE